MATEEQQILERIKVARGTAEPSTDAPTEEPEAVDVLVDDTPTEGAHESEAVADDESTNEVEELDVADNNPENNDEEQEEFFDLGGKEISLKRIQELEEGELRQSDYTRKTQALSDERRLFEAEREEFAASKAEVQKQLATLEAMVNEDSLTDEQLAEMREFEPEKYIEHTEKLNKRKEFLKNNKVNSEPQSTVNVQEEQAKMIAANPEWVVDGKATEAYQNDMNMLNDYFEKNGVTKEQASVIGQSAAMVQAFIDAAKFKSINNDNAAIKKRVRKAPVSTKPKQQAGNKLADDIKKAEAQVKRTGRPEDFVKLRQLKRQAKG